MKPKKIIENVYSVGSVDWNRRLFDSLIPLPDGTSYNSYLIYGSEKTVLIDTVDPNFLDEFKSKLADVPKIDYVVSLHAEQDHSGSIPFILDKYPETKLICSTKAKSLLIDLMPIPEEKIITVKDGDTLSVGDKTLEFIFTPWVHWPETMVAYLKEDKILFSCDFFGSHIATTDLFVKDDTRVFRAAKRYYAEIMMPFRKLIKKNLAKLSAYDISMIAPSHGPIYNKPDAIIELHKEWVDAPPKNKVVLPYISMHGSTKIMVDYLVSSLIEKGVTVELYDMTVTDIGKLAMSLVDAGTIIVGTPTVLSGPHPSVVYAVYLANMIRPKAKYLSIIGSYGWGGKTIEILSSLIPNLKVELLEPILAKGLPSNDDFIAIEKMAETIAAKHRENLFS